MTALSSSLAFLLFICVYMCFFFNLLLHVMCFFTWIFPLPHFHEKYLFDCLMVKMLGLFFFLLLLKWLCCLLWQWEPDDGWKYGHCSWIELWTRAGYHRKIYHHTEPKKEEHGYTHFTSTVEHFRNTLQLYSRWTQVRTFQELVWMLPSAYAMFYLLFLLLTTWLHPSVISSAFSASSLPDIAHLQAEDE